MRRVSLLCLLWVLFAMPDGALAQATGRIMGTAVDASNARPLAGVTVTVPGTQLGSLTGSDGRFLLTGVPVGEHQVRATMIGYSAQAQTVTIAADQASTVNFELQAEAFQMEGIVAVGYGTQQRRDVTGSVASVRAEEMRQIATSNPIIAMKGKVAGVDITHAGYAPGAGMRVRIRGARSLSATNEPLYVVDGIPLAGGIQDFNPGDIESVEILKDASATAIYGSRGANGVVMITTNQGRRGATRIEIDSRMGVSRAMNRVDVLDGPGFAQYKRDAYFAAGRYQCPTRMPCEAGDNALFSDPAEREAITTGRFTDWQDVIFREATEQVHRLGVSGGDERTRFAVTGEWHDEVGVVRGQDFDRKSLRGSVDHTIGRLRLGASTSLAHSTQNLSRGGGLVAEALSNNPLGPAWDVEGNRVFRPTSDPLQHNPLFDAENWIDERARSRAFASLFADIQLNDWLTFRSQFGPDLSFQRRGVFIGSMTDANAGSPGSARAEQQQERNFSYTLSNFFTVDRQLGTAHRFQATGLYEIQQTRYEEHWSEARQLPYEHQRFHRLDSGASIAGIRSNLQETALQSYMARGVYHLLDRYILTLTGRYDGSSRLAEGNKYAFFPSAALAWRVSDESFMRDQGVFNDLKLRLSWGRSGNSAVAPYQTQGGLVRTSYNFGNSLAFGYRPNLIENPSLRWERTTQIDLGLDFGILNNRITGAIDLYRADTDDLLMPRQLPATSGFTSVLENVGETRNTGIELSLSTLNIDAANGFRWSTDFNFARNKNEIVSLYGGLDDDIGNRWFIGRPIHNPGQGHQVFYDHEFLGIWQADQAAEAQSFGQKVGDVRVRDQNGDGVINDLDRIYLGDMYPAWTGGMTNRLEFRNIDLSVFAVARMGYTIFNGIGSIGVGRYNMLNVPYYTPDNPSNRYPQPNNDEENRPYVGTLWYEDGSHVRIRNITMGYSIPASLARRWQLSSARIYGSAHDPFLFTKFQGFDPEDATNATIPSSKKFLVGINIGL